jgi:Protein of unknown function (DUF3574)
MLSPPAMRAALIGALGIATLAATPSGAGAQAPSCHGARQPKLVAELLFGRDIGSKLGVSETAWARFLAHEVTPRFPDGLTVSDAVGQSRNPATGEIVQEASKRVEIVLPGNADDDAGLDAIVKAYRQQFRQHAVGVIVRAACVSF